MSLLLCTVHYSVCSCFQLALSIVVSTHIVSILCCWVCSKYSLLCLQQIMSEIVLTASIAWLCVYSKYCLNFVFTWNISAFMFTASIVWICVYKKSEFVFYSKYCLNLCLQQVLSELVFTVNIVCVCVYSKSIERKGRSHTFFLCWRLFSGIGTTGKCRRAWATCRYFGGQHRFGR